MVVAVIGDLRASLCAVTRPLSRLSARGGCGSPNLIWTLCRRGRGASGVFEPGRWRL